MLFSSIKGINRLMNKGMSNIYLKITIEKNWLSRNFVSRSVFGEHQLMQISQNFKTSCCNLKIRDLGTKQCVEKFYYFNFERNYDVFKLKRPYILLTKNINFNKNEIESKIENSTHSFREMSLMYLGSYNNRKLKVKLWCVGTIRKKREFFWYHLFCPKEIF